MKTEVLNLWANALASGDYQQGQYWLHQKPDKFDAFGVLCDLFRKNFGGEWKEVPDCEGMKLLLPKEITESMTMPPEVVLKWLGVKKRTRRREFVNLEGRQLPTEEEEPEAEFCHQVWRWNDFDKLSFAEIADKINGCAYREN